MDILRKNKIPVTCGALIAVMCIFYGINFRRLYVTSDAVPAQYIALSLVKAHNLDLDEYVPLFIRYYPDDMHQSQGMRLPYTLVAGKGMNGVHVVSTRGYGGGLTPYPVYLVAHCVKPLSALEWQRLAALGKWTMIFISALSVVMLYLIFTQLEIAESWKLLLCAAFGLGTTLWTVASRETLQHAPAVLCIVSSLYLLIKSEQEKSYFRYAAVPATLAIWMRPTTIVFFFCLALYGLVKRRDEMLLFSLMALPFILFLLGLNYYYFLSPFTFPPSLIEGVVAQAKTGSPHVWQTPYIIGLAGNLISPSRGLFVFSPFLLFCLLNIKYRDQVVPKPLMYFLSLTFAALTIFPSIHYDWWGGYSYGNRFLIEALPLLMILLANQIHTFEKHPVWRYSFYLTIALSLGIHLVGSMYYDYQWNVINTVDSNPGVIWDWSKSEIWYYVVKGFHLSK